MNAREKLRQLINNRMIGIIARGSSLIELEKKIEELVDYDICWCGINNFIPAESILNKINKPLEFVSDCSNVPNREYYEKNIRLPRLINYLEKPNNLLQISNTVIADIKFINREDVLEKYKNKIITIDEVFTNPEYPKDVWNAPPNSMTLLLAAIIAGGTKKIIMFGYDGHYGFDNIAVHTYYNPLSEIIEREAATGKAECGSLAYDTRSFNKDFPKIFEMYKTIYNNLNVAIVNCSPNSLFTTFKIINYNQLSQELNE